MALLIPWLAVEWHIRVPADAAGLTEAAQRFLTGQRMTDAYFDNNPPMCFLIYLPAALAARLGLPIWDAVAAYTSVLIALGGFLVFRLLPSARLPVESRRAVLAAFLAAVTFPAWLEFGQKDHLIAVMLLPFLLAQWNLTENPAAERRTSLAALALGVPFILIKPHYGLLPVLMLCHRLWLRRDWRIVRDADFLCLAIGVVCYAAVVLVKVPDYLNVILPYALTLYLTQVSASVLPVSLGLALASGCLVVLALCQPPGPQRKFGLFLGLMALASVVPFLVQMKGYSVHMLPCLSLLVPAALLLLTQARSEARSAFRAGRGFAGIALLFGLGCLAFTPHVAGRTRQAYENGPLATLLHAQAGPSGFFMESITTNVVVQTAVYTGIPQASRFPLLWFLPRLDKAPGATRTFFAEAIGADLDRFRPGVVLLLSRPVPGEDMPGLFADDPKFAAAWKHYVRQGRFRLDFRDYPADRPAIGSPPVDYDVYIRHSS